MVSPCTETWGRGSSKSLHFLIPGERGFCAPFPYSANVAQPDKSEVEEKIASDSEAELEAPIGAAALRQAV